jgi:5-methylcytosine-specific restriction protein A
MKLCTVCGVVTSRPGSRCTEHARQSNRSRHNALYNTREWQRLSARVLRAWRGEHGDWCPGYRRPAHPAADLTVDHVVPLAAGGGPFDIGNTGVLCRSCNSTKGGATARPEAAGVKVPETASPASSTYSTKGVSGADRGYPHADSAPVEDRASRLCARGRVSRIFPDPDHGPTQVCPWAPPLAHAAR